MESHYSLQELAFLYGETPEWEHQLALFTLDSILYLEEYPMLPDDIYVWESDEDLHPASRLLQTFAEEKKQELNLPICNVLSFHRTPKYYEF